MFFWAQNIEKSIGADRRVEFLLKKVKNQSPIVNNLQKIAHIARVNRVYILAGGSHADIRGTMLRARNDRPTDDCIDIDKWRADICGCLAVIGCLRDRANIEQLARRSVVISMLIRKTGGL